MEKPAARVTSREFVFAGMRVLPLVLVSTMGVSRKFIGAQALAWLLASGGMPLAANQKTWVERFAFWAGTELRALTEEVAAIDAQVEKLPVLAGVNSGVRTGFQSAGKADDEDLWVEVELAAATAVDTVVLVPLLMTKGASGEVAGFGFPRRFILEGTDADGNSVILMDETAEDFPNPGLYPVSAVCPPGTVLRQVRLTAVVPWKNEGPAVLALSELMMLHGNRNTTRDASVRSSSSREISPTWSRGNLVNMVTPLGLPLAPGRSKVMGWHGPVATRMHTKQAVSIDLGKPVELDEIRLVPAWRESMAWDTYYGFPSRFKVETSLTADFEHAEMVYDRTQESLLSPGQNLQVFPAGGKQARYVRVTATRLRNRTGDFVFALGELQAYAGNVNVAHGAPVISGDSVENSEWSRSGLTDGLSNGGVLRELPEWIRELEERRRLEIRRRDVVSRHQEVFAGAEHTLVGASVFGACGIVLMAAVFSWRGHSNRVLDRERHRERLARDLHDELGSNLGSIALISSFANQEDAAQMRLDLVEIELVARESADSMRDMVSLLGGRRGGVAADWLNVMNGLAERMIRGVELECRLPTAPLVWEPNLETRREIYLFCKEVLHNAARHGHPSHVKFHLGPTLQGLRVVISDDGCGFDPELVQSGHGLGNLRERAAMMRAEMDLKSAPAAGTRVMLDVPRGRRWRKC